MKTNIYCKGKLVSKSNLCISFFSKFKGLMFSKKLKKNESIILVGDYSGRLNNSIHMLFVFFSLDVLFLDEDKRVVDLRRAYPFVSFITPKKACKYVVEMNKGDNSLKIGDKVEFRS